MDKKKLFLWSLYDFANSIIYVNFLLYFAQWLVIDGGLSDFWYNAIFAIATIMLLFSAPMLAAQTDRNGGKKYFLNLATVGTFIAYGLSVWLAYQGVEYVVWSAVFFLVGQYFYQLAFVFYNPMLAEIADEKHRARASGIGQFANACGQVLGIGATLTLAGTRLGPLFPALIGFFALPFPVVVFYKESRIPSTPLRFSELKNDASTYVKKFYQFFAFSVATPMLIAFFLFNDALHTLGNNYSIILERVFATPDITKSLLLIGVLVMSAIGGITFGWIADRLGSLVALKIILAGWLIVLPLLAFAPTFTLFAILSVPVGLLIGSVFAVSRAYLSTLLSEENMGYGFSFYALAERFATFVGPLTWGAIITLGGASQLSYRVAIMSMAVFVLAGLLVLLFFRQRTSSLLARFGA